MKRPGRNNRNKSGSKKGCSKNLCRTSSMTTIPGVKALQVPIREAEASRVPIRGGDDNEDLPEIVITTELEDIYLQVGGEESFLSRPNLLMWSWKWR